MRHFDEMSLMTIKRPGENGPAEPSFLGPCGYSVQRQRPLVDQENVRAGLLGALRGNGTNNLAVGNQAIPKAVQHRNDLHLPRTYLPDEENLEGAAARLR